MTIFRFITHFEAHHICMLKHEFQHTALVSFEDWYHTNLFCHAVIVGN